MEAEEPPELVQEEDDGSDSGDEEYVTSDQEDIELEEMDEETESEQEETYESVRTSRSGCAVRPPVKYGDYQMLMLWTSNRQREKQEWQMLISSIHNKLQRRHQ